MGNDDRKKDEQYQIAGYTMRERRQIPKDQFKDFHAFLKMIKKDFRDFSIVEGQFRSRSNDMYSIVEAHFDCLDQVDFVLADNKSVAKELSSLSLRKAYITVEVAEEFVTFSDQKNAVPFRTLSPEYSDNPFIPTDQMKDIWEETIDFESPLIREKLSGAFVSRIYKMSRKFALRGVVMRHKSGNLNKGNIHIDEEGNGLQPCHISMKLNSTFLTPIKQGGFILIPSVLYIFNKSDVVFEVYLCKGHNTVAITHKAKVGKLSVTSYCRSSYLTESP